MNLTNRPIYRKGQKSRKPTAEAVRLDQQFLAWVRTQPSCLSGQFSEYLSSGDGRCVAAHHRTAQNSGTAIKPLFSAVPMTQDEHLNQHQHGADGIGSKAWWKQTATDYLDRWLKTQSKHVKQVVTNYMLERSFGNKFPKA